jgi:sugar phosphate isomerase/epimerase
MTSPNSNPDELRRREQALQARERALRLRELEAEIYAQNTPPEPPIVPTRRHQEPERAMQRQFRKVLEVAKFLGIVVAVVIAIRIATWLATAVMIGAVAWIAYKLFFEGDHRRNR